MNEKPEWLLELLEVPTTVAQAERIKKKFTLLLEALNNDESRHVWIACPHCAPSYPCYYCAYNARREVEAYRCCHMLFDGVMATDINDRISLSHAGAAISKRHCEQSTDDVVRKFLEAHILWANTVIGESIGKEKS